MDGEVVSHVPNVILGIIGGLILGVLGALNYSHFLGEGPAEAEWKGKLESAKLLLASATHRDQQNRQEVSSAADEIGQMTATNADIRGQLDRLKKDWAVAQQPINPVLLGQALRNLCFESTMVQPKLFLLKTRLSLTPEQEAKLKQSMIADVASRQQLLAHWLGGNRSDHAAAVADNVDRTLNLILSPAQQSQYQKIQADQSANHAQLMATVEVNNLVPLLQLSDEQKERAMNAVYQVQLSEPDPLTQPDCGAAFTSKMQKVQASLTQVLTPDQLALYQLQTQAFGNGKTGTATQN